MLDEAHRNHSVADNLADHYHLVVNYAIGVHLLGHRLHLEVHIPLGTVVLARLALVLTPLFLLLYFSTRLGPDFLLLGLLSQERAIRPDSKIRLHCREELSV